MRAHKDSRRIMAGVAIICLGLISIVGGWMEARRAEAEPTTEGTQAAVDRVRSQFEPGDMVWVHPHWWEGPWAGLQGAGPGADALPFPALLRDPSPDPARLLEARRLWVLSGFGRDASAVLRIEGSPEPQVSEEVAPGVRVLRYDLGPGIQIQRLTEDLDRCSVERRRPDGETVSCPLREGRFVCGLNDWLDVDVRTRDVAGRRVHWLYAHPGPRSGALSVGWPDVTRGAALLVRFGHTQASVRRDSGLPATVRILLDGAVVDEVTLDPHAYVIRRRLVTLEPGPPVHIQVEIQSPDPRWREVMLQVEMLPHVPPSVQADAEETIPYGVGESAR